MNRFINSDHLPQVLGIGDGISIATWNILKKCAWYEKPKPFYNNGFKRVETDDQYISRLYAVVEEISDIIQNHSSIHCIALQESPLDENYEIFTACLNEHLPHYKLLSHKTQSLLFDSSRVGVIDTTPTLLYRIGKNPHKLQSVRVELADQKFQIINLHLSIFKSPIARLDTIYKLIEISDPNSIILGDFNLNILELELDGFEKHAEEKSNLFYSEESCQVLRTSDGFIYRLAHER